MLKITTVNINNIKKQDRFEPEFWIIEEWIEGILSKNKSRKLSEYSKFIKKGIFDLKAEKYKKTGIPFLRISNLKYFELGTEDLVYISSEDNKSNSKTILRHGDIAFSKIGTLGKLLRVGRRFDEVNISQNIIGVGLKNNVNKNYIFAYLLSKLALLQIKKNKKKQLQDKLNLNDIRNIKIINLPEENTKQVSELVEKAEKKTEESISLLKKAQNLFYKELDVNFSKIKKKKFYSVNLSEFSSANLWTPAYSYPIYVNSIKSIKKKWPIVQLCKIATITKGNEVGSDNYNKYLDKKDNDVPFIRTSDLVNYEVDQFPDFYVPQEIYKDLNQDIKVGDILFTKDGKIGISAMITENDTPIIASGIVRLQLRVSAKQYNITPEYLFIVLSLKETGLYPAIRRTVIASTIPHLKIEKLKEFEIPILDKSSIFKITKIVKTAFKLKKEKKELITAMRKELNITI